MRSMLSALMHTNNKNKHYTSQLQTQSQPLLKIAIDVHLAFYVVAVQAEGTHPKPPQRLRPAEFLRWIDKQLSRGVSLVTCYEAGPLGFGLHRQLSARGVTNYVVRPRTWDEHHSRVKTDRLDALWMLNALKALALVRVPTAAQERRRSQTRLRQSLVHDGQMTAQRGRGMALGYGFRLKGDWFGRRSWPKWQPVLPLFNAARRVME